MLVISCIFSMLSHEGAEIIELLDYRSEAQIPGAESDSGMVIGLSGK